MTVWRVVHDMPLWRIGLLNKFVWGRYQAIAILEIDQKRKTQRRSAPDGKRDIRWYEGPQLFGLTIGQTVHKPPILSAVIQCSPSPRYRSTMRHFRDAVPDFEPKAGSATCPLSIRLALTIRIAAANLVTDALTAVDTGCACRSAAIPRMS